MDGRSGWTVHKMSRCLFVAGFVKYNVTPGGSAKPSVKVTLMDKDGRCVATANGTLGVLKVPEVNLWWPYLMHHNPGYLYSMEVREEV